MRLSIFSFLLCLMLCGCVSIKKYSEHLSENLKPQAISTNTWLTVKAQQNEFKGHNSVAVKNVFIPAIVYWGWRRDIENNIDEYTAITYFTNYIYEAADSLNLKKNIGDKNVSIDINQLPHSFIYCRKGHAVLSLRITKESITSSHQDLIANIIISSGSSTSHYQVNIQNEEKDISGSFSRFAPWFATNQYIDNFKKELKRMAIELVLKIKEKKE